MPITSVEAIQYTPLSLLPIDWTAIAPEQLETLEKELQSTEEFHVLDAERQMDILEMKKQRSNNSQQDGKTDSRDLSEQ
jgi:cytidylate kinase